jgi:hypothetical protein
VEPAARPERQPGHCHARPTQSLSVEHPAGRTGQRTAGPEHPITLFYMALARSWCLAQLAFGAGFRSHPLMLMILSLDSILFVLEGEG